MYLLRNRHNHGQCGVCGLHPRQVALTHALTASQGVFSPYGSQVVLYSRSGRSARWRPTAKPNKEQAASPENSTCSQRQEDHTLCRSVDEHCSTFFPTHRALRGSGPDTLAST